MDIIATKVPRKIKARAAAMAKRRRMSLSGLLRLALEKEIKTSKPRTWGERLGHLMGTIKNMPANLSEIEGFD
jgi:hypothetical protein